MFGFFKKPTKHAFAVLVLDRIRAAGGPADLTYDVASFALVRSKQQVFLGNVFADYCRASKAQREVALANLVAATLDLTNPGPTLDEIRSSLVIAVRERLMFSITSLRWEIEHHERREAVVAHEPLTEWFMRTVVVDSPSHIKFVTEEDLQRWNLTVDEALAIGLENLSRCTLPRFTEDNGVFHGVCGDSYDASRSLIAGVFDDLPIHGKPVFTLPNLNTLLVADSENPDAICRMLARSETILREQPRPQNCAPLIIRAGQIQDYTVSADSPAAAAVQRARGMTALNAYEEQKGVLQKLYEKTGKDVFVGSVSLYRKAEGANERYVTVCVLSRDVATLLPVTDEVLFHDHTVSSENKVVAQVPWAKLWEYFSDQMLDTKMYPARYYVSKFPDRDWLARFPPKR